MRVEETAAQRQHEREGPAAPASPAPPGDGGAKAAGPGVSRRAALGRIAACGAACAGVAGGALWLHDRRPPQASAELQPLVRDFRSPDGPQASELVFARQPEGAPGELVRAVLRGLGGMGRFVRSGERVLIKPNVGWDRNTRQAANTHPEVVSTLVLLCREAGASEVIVSDVSCNDARRAFTRSGVGEAAQKAGARVLLPSAEDFLEVAMGGAALRSWPVLSALLRVDRFINVPVVKHHSLTGLTCAMKNLYGVIGGKRNLLHQQIHQSIYDLGAFLRPTLVLVDAIRVLFRNGPQGGSFKDVRAEGQVAATVDPVAADAWAAAFLGLQPKDVRYVALADGKLGSAALTQVRQVG